MSTATVPLYSIPIRNLGGEDTTHAQFKGKVILIVDVALKFGLNSAV